MARIKVTRRSIKTFPTLIFRTNLPLSNPQLPDPCYSYIGGVCMVCKQKSSLGGIESVYCQTCQTPWHLPCSPSTSNWECPDCSYDPSLTDEEVLVGRSSKSTTETKNEHINDVLDNYCSFCMELPERPVTTPCGHNFCLECFEKWMKQGKQTCPNCRTTIPAKMASTPRINTQLAIAIRMAKLARSEGVGGTTAPNFYHIVHKDKQPNTAFTMETTAPNFYYIVHKDKQPNTAFTMERAVKPKKVNGDSGKIFVTIAKDHFGPIVAENDPTRNRGVLVGNTWEDRMECRQWGAHFPPVARIAGQRNHGAQSVVLSGGYINDENHGDWFIFTGSGGKNEFVDQKFNNINEALRLSFLKGYPVRVVRSHKEKNSSYAPEAGVRYDGAYRIEICWCEFGKNGQKVCRYLFMRCDNEPAPWTSDLSGDCPRPLPFIEEFRYAEDIIGRNGDPSWDFDEEKGCWLWKKPPTLSKRPPNIVDPIDGTKTKVDKPKAKNVSFKIKNRLLKEFGCNICRKVFASPLTTPCAHNFCKTCLEGRFSGQSSQSGHNFQPQKNIMKCPTCLTDITDYLQYPQVNREMMSAIESLQLQAGQMEESSIESSGRSDENVKMGEQTKVAKPCDSSEEVSKEVIKNDLNPPQKRRKGVGGKVVMNGEEHY